MFPYHLGGWVTVLQDFLGFLQPGLEESHTAGVGRPVLSDLLQHGLHAGDLHCQVALLLSGVGEKAGRCLPLFACTRTEQGANFIEPFLI